ncbi:MAG TPA: ubiquinol-cytochrome c reductase iron-sulfur subunit [Chloroflexia bacterium]|nr:ubiquinol-cytochrome c reductase iron-sulfur subunit [Chloroflexia bacterium]
MLDLHPVKQEDPSRDEDLDRPENNSRLTRRKFLKWGIYGMAASVTTVIALPAVGYYVAPAFETTSRGLTVPVGKVSELANQLELKEVTLDNLQYVDGFKAASVNKKFFVRALKPQAQTASDFLVLDVTCTHLGCAAFYNPPGAPAVARDKIYCFCHGSIYDQDGNVVRGPAARPLGRYKVSIEKGQVTINAFQSFA